MYDDPNAWLMGGGKTPSISWRDRPIGYIVTGTVCRESKMMQQRDPENNEPLYWDDARTQPKMQLVVYLQTTERDLSIEDDDGIRALYIKGKSLTEGLREAVKRAGSKGVEIGATVTVIYTGEGERTKKVYSPPKLFKVEYRPPADAASARYLGGAPAERPATAAVTGVNAGPPAGVDPTAWRNLDEARRAQVLAGLSGSNTPPF